MSIISKKTRGIAPSSTSTIAAFARELVLSGANVINFGIGEPDFDTPDNIKQAAVEALAKGQTKYSAVDGIIELRSAICKKLSEENGLNYNTSACIVTAGAKAAIYLAMAASLNPGDEVIVLSPYWVSYPPIVELCGGKAVIVHPKQRKKEFKITSQELRAAITDKTKWIILNSPSNPSGCCYSKEELQDLFSVVKDHNDIWVLSDEIYEKFVYSDTPYCSLAKAVPSMFSRIATINGFSKSYAMTGWRIGYCCGSEILIKAMKKIQGQLYAHVPTFGQWGAVEALLGSQEYLIHFKEVFQKRRDLLIENLNSIEGIKVSCPEGAFYLFVNIENFIGKKTPEGALIDTDVTFTEKLLGDYHVATVAGTAFGYSPYFRISYPIDDDNLLEGSNRIKKFCESLT